MQLRRRLSTIISLAALLSYDAAYAGGMGSPDAPNVTRRHLPASRSVAFRHPQSVVFKRNYIDNLFRAQAGGGPIGGPGPVPGPWIVNGNTISYPGKVFTAPSNTTQSGFTLGVGIAPSSPINGDLWATASGLFAQINGLVFNLALRTITINGTVCTIGGSCGIATGGVVAINCSGSDNTSAINTALAGGGHVALFGTCVMGSMSGSLVIPSNTWLDLGKSTLSYSPPTWNYMLYNTQHAQNVQRSFADATTTSGSGIVGSAASAVFTEADVGQSIACIGALGPAPGLTGFPGVGTTTLHSRIAEYVSATSVVLDDPAGVTFSSGSPTTCSILVRDTNIKVSGGTWIFGGAVVTGSTGAELSFLSVNNLTIDDLNCQNGTTGVVSSSGSKNISVSDAQNWSITNITFASWVELQDGIDDFGPSRNGLIRNIKGHTGDNSVAITPFGAFTGIAGQGNIADILVDNIGTAGGFSMVRVFGPDSGTLMLVDRLTFSHVHASNYYVSGYTGGSGNGIQLINGNMGTILIDDVSGNLIFGPIAVTGSIIQNLAIKNLSSQYSTFNSTGYLLNIDVDPYNASVPTQIGNLDVDGLRSDGDNLAFDIQIGSNPASSSSGNSIQSMTVRNVQLTNLAGSITPFYFARSTIGDLIFDNVQLNYNSATAPTYGGIAYFQGSSIGRLSFNAFHVSHQSGSVSGGYLFDLAAYGGTIPSTLGDLAMSDVSYTSPTLLSTYLYLAPSASGLATASLNNIRLNNITGCNFNYASVTTNVQMSNAQLTNLTTPASCPISTPFTVATLPAGGVGGTAFVSDAITCTLNGSLTGGGSTFCRVHYNGSAWVGG